ncbi:R3H domain protein [Clostridium acetireducens DSM 10703]|jgi:spoIIIJ-associated protein|uniref:RNA-binding protein KhpB n=1 Tax=Clostridium acetireducens DSM 10703 TaxID=1121290 RepID=A0A1E8EXA2_9CLOT|nr:RNA-binding cell elongation regulator Jag/EloR [Clostridium acetireducens]OFI05396.1 R3H domain protein [Clostridium acetireducens DSM 10703]
MKSMEVTGKTVKDAIENALKELNVQENKLDIQVIDEGSKGLFNFIGGRPAKINVKLKKDYVSEASNFIKDILKNMKVEAEVKVLEKNNVLNISLIGDNMGILIGYRGETLDALQYLTSLAINKDHEMEYKKVIIDAENYRAKREQTLKNLAKKLSEKVKYTKRPIKLEPMNPYERRIIHFALQNNEYVETYSEGEEPHRRVVIDMKKA